VYYEHPGDGRGVALQVQRERWGGVPSSVVPV